MEISKLFPIKCDKELCVYEYEGRCSLHTVEFDFLNNCCSYEELDSSIEEVRKIKNFAKNIYI